LAIPDRERFLDRQKGFRRTFIAKALGTATLAAARVNSSANTILLHDLRCSSEFSQSIASENDRECERGHLQERLFKVQSAPSGPHIDFDIIHIALLIYSPKITKLHFEEIIYCRVSSFKNETRFYLWAVLIMGITGW